MIDDQKENNLIWESYLGNLAKAGAMATASVLGSTPNTTMADTTYYSNYENVSVLTNETIVKLWSRYYQTSNDLKKEKRALDVLNKGYKVPKDAKIAIDVAAYIYTGDMGVSGNVIEELLAATGAIESDYRTKIQYGGGPAVSYWQIEPETAIDVIINSRGLMGNKFKSMFPYYNDIFELNKQTESNRKKIKNMLLKDDNLAASFATMVWLRQAGHELSKVKN